MLSTHFSIEELTFSDSGSRLGLSNVPPPDIEENLRRLCNDLLEEVRVIIGKPIHINSGYRSPAVNMTIGGAKNSEHLDGRAADFRVPGMTPYEVCRRLETYDWLPFNQMIHEFGSWTHISIPKLGDVPKRELLTAERIMGKTVYHLGIVPIKERT